MAGQVYADPPGIEKLPGQAGHDFDGVRPAYAYGAGAESPGVGGVGVGADDHGPGEGVLLEHDLVDDAGAGTPEADAELGRGRFKKVVDFAILFLGLEQVEVALRPGLDKVVAVNRRRHRGLRAARLHELEHDGLPQHVLEGHPVGVEEEVAPSGLHLLAVSVVEVRQEQFVRERQRLAEPSADGLKVAAHDRVCGGGHLWSGLYDWHAVLPRAPLLYLGVGEQGRALSCRAFGARGRRISPCY